jgi:ATP-binding cassette subfamily B protein
MEKSKRKTGIPRLLELAGNAKPFILFSCVLSVLSALASLVPYICVYFVIRNTENMEWATLTFYGWVAVAFVAAQFLLYFSALMCSHIAAFKTTRNIKSLLLKHLVTLPMGFHTENPSGKLRKIIENNVEQTEGCIAPLPDLIASVVTPVVTVVILFIVDWKMGLLCLIPIVVGLTLQASMTPGNKEKNYLGEYQKSLEDMNNSAVEYVRGISVVKVFGQTIYSFKNFLVSIKRYEEYMVKYILSFEKSISSFVTAINSAFFVLVPAGILLSRYASDYGHFVLGFIFFAIFMPVMAGMLMHMRTVISNQMKINDSIQRIDELLNEKPLPEPLNVVIPQDSSIVFNHVSFTYKGNDVPAVSDISFTAPQGTVTALVGPSGGGKTTIASLILRFWDVDNGSVTIGGADIRNIPTEKLMEEISFVFQDVHLFKNSILENIRFSRPAATREEVLQAASAAQCMDILEKMPDGIDTVIGTKGIYLSGGEQQRIALARAMLKESSIIILDEATAFADPENETKIQAAFNSLIQNKTVLMIAHRLSTVRNADQILVLDQGEIAEQGSHHDLIAQKGIYQKMWDSYQSGVKWRIGKEAPHVS